MSKLQRHSRSVPPSRTRQRGLSLIELMVALVISLVLIGGAIQVYVFSRQNYEVNESVVRLQETARYALSILEPDIRMANSWGLSKGAGFVVTASGLPATNCGADFASAVMTPVDGANNQYSFECPADGAGAVTTADTLVIRRASAVPSTETDGRLLVCSTRTSLSLVIDSSTCVEEPIGQVNDLLVNAYYIGRDSAHQAGLPTLHRWSLVAPDNLDDVGIVPGVEDMQIQFGIDSTGVSGTATGYVNPGEVPAGAQVVSVRLWLLVRSETEETGFTDTQTYEYGDRSDDNGGTTDDLDSAGAARLAYKPNDGFRRLLVSRTIVIRNAMGT
ncbi:type IV minor pilin protein PilW [Steroidobacter agaridevorans]|uniref:Type IV minor pilin protein PilW n=1 Tax=Steroidobacter agaridevorans TaxID=2695856 RepID=A0A829YDD1_9GAMM|nr:PilW family protein [Steroidobacter agaridevorans]GFE80838.1 type IV minor pilin protein PilW [Steroidobacter agaridevorans]GFE87939.1 type IV minor pilin protein PilW [Steroidobacter agaridevorans]